MSKRMLRPGMLLMISMLVVAVWPAGISACTGSDDMPTKTKGSEAVQPDHGPNVTWLVCDEPRLLYVYLKLRKDTIRSDTRIVQALDDLRWFTHIILVVPSWQERPHATTHPLVRQALATCQERKISVIWGRCLWVAWWPKHARTPRPATGEFDAAHYVAAISTVKNEARAIGAVGTFLDSEPYGECAQKWSLKRKKLTDVDRRRIHEAMDAALNITGPVDVIYPSSSSPSWHFAWSMAELGTLRCDSKTYFAKAPRYKLPKIRPPSGYAHRVDLWGSAVGLGRPEDVYNGNAALTPSEVVALDRSIIRQRFPHCRGFWVWVPNSILPEVIRSWPR